MSNHSNDNLHHVFKMTGDGQELYGLAHETEQPHQRIEVKVRLQKDVATVLKALYTAFTEDNMEVRRDRNNDIIVSGTLSDNRFTAQSILRTVRNYDNRAQLLP